MLIVASPNVAMTASRPARNMATTLPALLAAFGVFMALFAMAVTPASAATAPADNTALAFRSSERWTVPPRVTSATFEVYGAQGAGVGSGLGGEAIATLPLTPGQSLDIFIGQPGATEPVSWRTWPRRIADLTVIFGADLAYITPEVTLQAEATLFQLTRVRGPNTQDGSRTNLTAGLHAGHFFSPQVSLGAELRVQNWLSTPAPVRTDPEARQQWTFGIGPRFHFRVGNGWLRPGVSYSRALDDPLANKAYNILQFDVPYAF